MTEVAAALIWHGDRFLICKRPKGKARAGLYEFVGGKAEAGETLSQALVRECKEELDVNVSVGKLFTEVTYTYPDIIVHLAVFNAEIIEGEPKALEHEDLRWITVDEIDNYDFCPADEPVLLQLKEREGMGKEAMPRAF